MQAAVTAQTAPGGMAPLLYVMGPSGAGKDSLLQGVRPLLADLPVAFVRRYITRPAGRGEWHIPLTRERFARLCQAGTFALTWESHGLCYGIAASADCALAHGITMVVNGSREALPRAVRRFPSLVPLCVDVHLDVLRARLAARGRENEQEMAERLARASLPLPEVPGMQPCLHLDNSGELATATLALADIIRKLTADYAAARAAAGLQHRRVITRAV